MFVKNHKKINEQKRFLKIKIWAVKWTQGKQTQIIDGKKIICKYSLIKTMS